MVDSTTSVRESYDDGESRGAEIAVEGTVVGRAAIGAEGQNKENGFIGEVIDDDNTDPERTSSFSSNESSQAIDATKDLYLKAGQVPGGKIVKDLESHKFWKTQPVARFNETFQHNEEGPIQVPDIKSIPTSPPALAIEGFEWVTVDVTNDTEMNEVYDLLKYHYVEDDEGTLRFRYPKAMLKWAMMSPGWKKQWHIGIRIGRTLCAFISAIPIVLRVKATTMHASEVNFLCVHKKLRSKRLTPILIKEITRLCNLEGVWQAIYTAGIILPTPISTCRYFHRPLNWEKLYEVGFSHVPSNSRPSYQIGKYALPSRVSTRGLREMQERDLGSVHSLLERYLNRFDIAAKFTQDECEHWLLYKKDSTEERVVWTYVVEDDSKNITDFFSFYGLESSVIGHPKHSVVCTAYAFYYASETGLRNPLDKSALETRLNSLMNDALILAKKHGFDVFNAPSIMDNGLFLEQQKFGPGTGQLHYYLFNYRVHPIAGGVDQDNNLDKDGLSGLGLVML